tara:strand:+ start:51 stop:296 length:246 start_codon:yes stop_codon:yes gene_type:complete
MPKVSYSINGFRRGLAGSVNDLKEELEDIFDDIHPDNKERLENVFNELACISNSFNCVHVKGLEEFDDLSEDPVIELLNNN